MSPPNPLYSSVEPERVKFGAVRIAHLPDVPLSPQASWFSSACPSSIFSSGSSVYKYLASGRGMVMPVTSSPWLVEWLPVVGGQSGGAREGS